MNDNIVVPEFNKNAFTCPHCQVLAKMDFVIPSIIQQKLCDTLDKLKQHIYKIRGYTTENIENNINDIAEFAKFYGQCASAFAICQCCQKISIWVDNKMVYPKSRLTPPPNEDLPNDIQADYEEASLIVQDSPRGACALLRLALQKLMIQEMVEDKNLNKAIQSLVDKNIIDETLQKTLDSVRVIGNNAVHPNELDIKDDKETAIALFKIINYIAEKMLTDKRKINEIYDKLPESAKREKQESK